MMGTNKQTKCQRCPAMAYGTLCRNCSLADLRSRKQAKASVNSVGEFNAGQGGFSAESGIAFPKVLPTVGPWWIGLSRDEFYRTANAHADRMSRGPAANFRVEPVVNWQ